MTSVATKSTVKNTFHRVLNLPNNERLSLSSNVRIRTRCTPHMLDCFLALSLTYFIAAWISTSVYFQGLQHKHLQVYASGTGILETLHAGY